MRFNSILEIKQANHAAGYYWFTPSTMRFFNSRVSTTVYPVSDGALFVSSEKDGKSRRLYTVRYAHGLGIWRGKVETVGAPHAYGSLAQAKARAAYLAANWQGVGEEIASWVNSIR